MLTRTVKSGRVFILSGSGQHSGNAGSAADRPTPACGFWRVDAREPVTGGEEP
jgi:hypothetical protein